jgi:hypothetical protein
LHIFGLLNAILNHPSNPTVPFAEFRYGDFVCGNDDLLHVYVGASVEGSTYDDDAVGQMLPLSNAAADASAILHQID